MKTYKQTFSIKIEEWGLFWETLQAMFYKTYFWTEILLPAFWIQNFYQKNYSDDKLGTSFIY